MLKMSGLNSAASLRLRGIRNVMNLRRHGKSPTYTVSFTGCWSPLVFIAQPKINQVKSTLRLAARFPLRQAGLSNRFFRTDFLFPPAPDLPDAPPPPPSARRPPAEALRLLTRCTAQLRQSSNFIKADKLNCSVPMTPFFFQVVAHVIME